MTIKEIQINKIKRDPSQPRMAFSEEAINNLSSSIKKDGLINPIEVDSKNIIVTGEMRWKAAKKAGLKTITCKIIDVFGEDRSRRQLVENFCRTDLTQWEYAQFLKKYMKSVGQLISNKKLGEKLNISETSVKKWKALLEASEPMKKAVKKGMSNEIPMAIKYIDNKIKSKLEDKIIKEKIPYRNVMQITAAIKRTPDKANEILKEDYSKDINPVKTANKVRAIAPTFVDVLENESEALKELDNHVKGVMNWLDKNPKKNITNMSLVTLKMSLLLMCSKTNKWLKK